MPNFDEKSLELHRKKNGKLEIKSKVPLATKEDLAIAYTPGVAAVSRLLSNDKNASFEYTIKGNSVCILSDGSRVLGLGDIGPYGAIPVMEGKAILFKEFANIDAFPICVDAKEPKEIIDIAKKIAPIFGGINLEDISVPKCFEIEDALQDIGIPVMHDDQHGTAVAIFAGLINAAKVVNKKLEDMTIVVNGAGAAGSAVVKLLAERVRNIIAVDSKGILEKNRKDIEGYKKELLKLTNKENIAGDLELALKGVDCFIGLSVPGALKKEWIKTMAKNPIVFALANPIPEITPDEAIDAGAVVVGTGRSDFPNQINNALAFPGIFRGALDARAK